jgi:hypothetical protein
VIKIKSRGLSTRNQGHERKNTGWRVNSQKPEGSFNKISKRTGIGFPRPLDLGSTAEIRSTGERARLTGGPRWAVAWGQRVWQVGPDGRGTGEGTNPSDRILNGWLGLDLIYLNRGHPIGDEHRGLNGWPERVARVHGGAPPETRVWAHRGPWGTEKVSERFRGVWRTRPWAQHRHTGAGGWRFTARRWRSSTLGSNCAQSRASKGK